jgi:hypothetical protein
MSGSLQLRGKTIDAAARLLAQEIKGEEAESLLAVLLESLYRLAVAPEELAELRSWLEPYAAGSRQARLWLALVHLAEDEADDPWRNDLAAIEHLLPASDLRADVFIRTQAAQEVWRLTSDPCAALSRLRGLPAPPPELQETAVDAVCLRLRLATDCGDWAEHDHLAKSLGSPWINAAGEQADWVRVVLAEHAMQRGENAVALNLLSSAGSGIDDRMRLALLGTRLRALLASGGSLEGGTLAKDVERVVNQLRPLLQGEPPRDEEGRELFERCVLLVKRAQAPRSDDGTLRLEEIEAVLLSGHARENSEAMLRYQLEWVRRALEQRGTEIAGTLEPLVTSVIHVAEMQGLTVVQLMAYELRADLRAHYMDGHEDLDVEVAALADAGKAANLGVHILDRNRGTEIEQSFRRDLLPVLDRAIELLAEMAQRSELDLSGQDERRRTAFGRALLDYIEQVAELALSEARRYSREGGQRPPGMAVALGRVLKSSGLQKALKAKEGVLQYFLVSHFLIIVAYGPNFIVWKIQERRPPEPNGYFPIRAHVELLLQAVMSQRHKIRAVREVREVRPREAIATERSEKEALEELADLLLPANVIAVLDDNKVRHLAIVPHDVLYRTPFASLPWKDSSVGVRFILSLQPTGGLAGRHDASSWSMSSPKVDVGFVKGPGLKFADAEREALCRALRWRAVVVQVDTVVEGSGAFSQKAPMYDVLYLACHGRGEMGGGAAYLVLGTEGHRVTLSETAALDLRRCGLAVLQSCWTGWMDHRREFPAQGFPQALRDAGVVAVVAPMFPVDDSLCPVFTAVFGRLLRFLPAGQALSRALEILRRYGASLLEAHPSTWGYRNHAVFDAYEYRFTGDPDLRLHGGWLSRLMGRCDLALWMAGQRVLSFSWRIRDLPRSGAG